MAETDIPPLPKGFTPISDGSTPPLPKGFVPIAKQQTIAPTSVQGLNNFTQPSVPNSPVTDPALKQQMQQHQEAEDAVRQQRATALSNQLKQHLSALNPETKAQIEPLIPRIANPDQVTATSPEDEAHYRFMQTVPGKALGALAYLGSKATKGSLDVIKGAAHLANLANNPLNVITGYDPSDPLFAKADKLANYGLTPADEDRMTSGKGGGLLNAAGMMAEFAPAVATGEGIGGQAPKALMYLQGVGQGKDLADKIPGLNPQAKEALIQGSGAVNLLLTDVFKGSNVSSGVKSKVVSSIAADAIKDAADKDITAQGFKDLLAGKAQDFAQKFEQAPVNALSHYLETAKTFTKLNAANFALHKAVDELNDKPVFNENLGNLADQEYNSLTKQAPIFAALPALGELSKLTPYSGYKNDVVESIVNDPSEANVSDLKAQLAEHAGKNGWSENETGATLAHVDQIADAAKKLPANLSPDKKADAVGIIMERNDLQNKLEDVMQQKAQLDPALQEVPTPQEQFINDKIEQANDKLKGIASGNRVTYSNPEEGTFLKTTNGVQEKITPERYSLEKMERDAGKEPAVEGQTPEPEVESELTEAQPLKAVDEQTKIDYPYPQKPIDEMSSDEIREHAKNIRNFYKGLDKLFFGEEGAKEYQKAIAVENSPFSTYEQRQEAYAITKKYHDSLSPNQYKIFFGENADYDDPDDLRDLAQRIHFIEESENVDELAGSIKNPLLDFASNRNERDTNVLLKSAARKAQELGIDPKLMLKKALDRIHSDLPGGEGNDPDGDKALLTKSILEAISKKSESIDTGQKQLSEGKKELPIQNDPSASNSQISGNTPTQGDDTGIRNADVAEERGENVPRPSMTHEEIDAEGKRLVDSGELDADSFAKRVVNEKIPVTAEQSAALLYRKTQLNNRQRAILKDTDPENNLANQAEYARNEDLLEQNRRATELAGNITGRSLAYRRQLMKEDYSLSHLLARAKLFNGGEDVSPDIKAKLEAHSKRITDLQNQLLDREEEIRKLQDKNTVSDVKRNGEFEDRQAKRTSTKASLRKEREDLLADLHLIAKKSMSSAGANKIPVEMLVPLAKLARNYVMDGAITIASVADKVYNDIKDALPGVNRDDVEDAIKGEFDKYLAEKNEQRLTSAKKRQQTKLDALKEGTYEKKVYSKIQVDNDYLRIRAEINREQTKINKQIADIANSQKSAGRRAVDLAVKYGRQAKLASVTVLGKLAAAGLTTAGLKPLTETAGKAWSAVLPKIAEKSIVEGSVPKSAMFEAAEKTGSVKSFSEAYARAVFKGMEDSAKELNIKKGGQSDLSALYGKNPVGKLPAEAAELFGHIHSAIKAPIKRFAWEHSYAKRVAKGIQSGIDVTDPVIDAKNRLDAYKDAERAIFMGDNKASSIYETAVKSLENSKNATTRNVGALARIIFPFVKVPTNIVLSSGRYAFGLVPGLSKVAQVGTSAALRMAGAEKLAGLIHIGMGELTPEESDIVLRNLKHGSIGGTALALGFFNPKLIGGYYQPGEKRKPNEVQADQVGKLPIWMTEHPIFQAMQIGATFRRLIDAHRHKDDKIPAAILGTASGIAENIPLAEGAKNITEAMNSDQKMTKFLSSLVKGEIEPAAIQQLATITDTKNRDAFTFDTKNQVKRAPDKKHGAIKYIKQDLATGIPVLRETVPRKH